MSEYDQERISELAEEAEIRDLKAELSEIAERGKELDLLQ